MTEIHALSGAYAVASVRPLPPEVPAAATSSGPARTRRLSLLVAAAAAVVLVGAGAVAWQQPWSEDSSQVQLSATDRVLTASDAKSTSLEFPGGASATVTHDAGRVVVLFVEN